MTLQQHYSTDYEGLQDEFTYRIVARPLCDNEIEGENKISDATLRDMVPPSPKDGDNHDITLTEDTDGNYVGTFTLKQNASITLNFTMPVWASETAGRRHFFYRIEPIDSKPQGSYYIDTQGESDKAGANVYTFEVFVKLGTTSTATAYVWSAVHNGNEVGALVTTPAWKVVNNPVLFGNGATHTWSTFCAQDDYQLPEGCTAYTLKSVTNGVVTVSPLTLTDNILPAYVPVMIHRSSTGATTSAIQAEFAAVGDLTNGWELTDQNSMMYQRNDIYPSGVGYQYGGAWGECHEAVVFGNPGKTGEAIMGWITPTSSNYHTFFSFYNDQLLRIEGDPGIQLHRCVVRVNNENLASSSQQAPRLVIEGETTGIVSIDNGQLTIDNDAWYTLDGRKLEGKPTTKGIYINKGVKVVIK